jgi:hypothetical protein
MFQNFAEIVLNGGVINVEEFANVNYFSVYAPLLDELLDFLF